MAYNSINRTDFVEPRGSTTSAFYTVKKESIIFKTVQERGGTSQPMTGYRLDCITSELTDAVVNRMALLYEYYRIANIIYTISFVGNWLTQPVGIELCYVSDPSIYTAYDGASSEKFIRRQITTKIIKPVTNHKWVVPNFKRWLFTRPGVNQRMNQDGIVMIKQTPLGPNTIANQPGWRVTVDCTFKFRNTSLILQKDFNRISIGYWKGAFEPTLANISFPQGDNRNAVITFKTKNPTFALLDKKTDYFVFSNQTIQLLIEVMDTPTVVPETKYFKFTTGFTFAQGGNYVGEEQSGYTCITIPVTVGFEVDFTTIHVKDVLSPADPLTELYAIKASADGAYIGNIGTSTMLYSIS